MRRRHPKRTVTRAIRSRRPLHPGRERDELEATTWPEGVRVADCMSRSVTTIRSDAAARAAADSMRGRKIRHLPVLDREGRLVGIVTDRDVRHVVFHPARLSRFPDLREALDSLTVADVMTAGVITVRPAAGILEAARLMHERKLGALPVVDGDRLVGIVTETDVLKTFSGVLAEGVGGRPS